MAIAFAFDCSDLLGKFAIAATSAAAGDLLFVGICLVEPLHVVGKLFIGLVDELGQRPAGEVAVLVVDCLDPRAVDSQQLTTEEIELTSMLRWHSASDRRLDLTRLRYPYVYSLRRSLGSKPGVQSLSPIPVRSREL